MTDSDVLDTSVWISYFFKDSITAKELIDTNSRILASAITLYEVKKRLLHEGKSAEVIEQVLEFIKKRAVIVELSNQLLEKAARFAYTHSLCMADAIVYASLPLTGTLWTKDNDFSKLPRVRIVTK